MYKTTRTAHGQAQSSRYSAKRVARAREFLAGLALLPLLASVVAAQSPGAGNPGQRAAVLLPPRPLAVSDAPVIARGAIDDSVGSPYESTPVARRPRQQPVVTGPGVPSRLVTQPSGPDWPRGPDGSVVPAGGAIQSHSGMDGSGRQSPAGAPNDPSVLGRGLNKFKAFVGSERPPSAGPTNLPNSQASPNRPGADPNAPLQGVAANGAPVLAGPPAWRWYGYGTVTPGANEYAPNGQYPRASGNWYSVTKATPGAFPVPVANPYRPTPGNDPPTYVMGPANRAPAQDVRGVETYRSPSPPPTQQVPTPRYNPPLTSPVSVPRNSPAPTGVQPAQPGPALTNPSPLHAPRPIGPESRLPTTPLVPQSSVGVPTLTPPPSMAPVAAAPQTQPEPAPVAPVATAPPVQMPEPVAVSPTTRPTAMDPEARRSELTAHSATPSVPERTSPISTTVPDTTAAPAQPAPPTPLPRSMTEEIQWQSNPNSPVTAPPGTWVPSNDKARRPASPEGNNGSWQPQPGASIAPSRPIARGQIDDSNSRPDPVVSLVQAMCRDRATDVDVRRTGSQKLTICFETRTEATAKQLVKDISARPELAPFQIDFCVLVK